MNAIFVNLKGKWLAVSRKMVDISAVRRQSHHPVKTPQ